MKISCLRFPSSAVLQEFIRHRFPYVVEEVDTLLCGVFSDTDIAYAVQHFNATLLAHSQQNVVTSLPAGSLRSKER